MLDFVRSPPLDVFRWSTSSKPPRLETPLPARRENIEAIGVKVLQKDAARSHPQADFSLVLRKNKKSHFFSGVGVG